jgi:hypothetical protein
VGEEEGVGGEHAQERAQVHVYGSLEDIRARHFVPFQRSMHLSDEITALP